jgi:2-hydroxy-3-oxopropionate reductase
MHVGFIGLGAMGTPMARNLQQGGHTLHVWARRPEATQALVQAGATAASTPAELASRCDAICIMVTNTADVESVLFGEQGIVHGARPGTIVIDMSTISPNATRVMATQLATRNIDMLDAPVSGGISGAEAATLSIMVGGKAEVLQKARPLLECMGKTIVHIGDNGAGQVAKACNQLALCVTQQGVAEALLFAEKNGVDGNKVRAALLGGFASSKILGMQGDKMLKRDFTPRVDARLHHKDMGIVLQIAHERGLALPAAAITLQIFNALMNAENGGHVDSAAVITVLEKACAKSKQ